MNMTTEETRAVASWELLAGVLTLRGLKLFRGSL